MRLIVIALAAVLIGCPLPVVPPQPNPTDPTAVTCDAYCAHLRELECPSSRPTKKGASCEVVCSNIESSGFVHNARSCSMSARSCAAVDACER